MALAEPKSGSMVTGVHPTAIVEPGAKLGADCEIMAYAVVTKHCVLGDRVVVHPFAVIGGDPQYSRFERSISSTVQVGAGTVLREHVTINRSILPGGRTVVGENCLLMAASHVAHDCVVGGHVVFANGVLLGGHVSVGDHTVFGGAVAVHQFCRIGENVMVAGHASISEDVPPFVMVADHNQVIGLNSVGLRRRGMERGTVSELKGAFRAVYSEPGNLRAKAATLLEQGGLTTPEARRFLEFFAGGQRAFARMRRGRK